MILGRVVQSVASLTSDPGIASLIPAPTNTFMEIDYEILIISSVILLLPLIQEGLRQLHLGKYVHEVLVYCLVKLVQEESVVRLTDCIDMTI